MKATTAAVLAAVLTAGCSSIPVEPTPITPTAEIIRDGCGSALGIVGRTLCATALGIAPGATELLDGVDAARIRASEKLGAARDRRNAAELERRRLEFCMANPDYGPCAAIVEAALGLSAGCGSGATQCPAGGQPGSSGSLPSPYGSPADAGSPPGSAPQPTEAQLRAAASIKRHNHEGGPLLEVVDGHFCYGASTAWNTPPDAIDADYCEKLLLDLLADHEAGVDATWPDLPTAHKAVLMELVYMHGLTGTKEALGSDPGADAVRTWAGTFDDGRKARMLRLAQGL